jgi:hypothetical protein
VPQINCEIAVPLSRFADAVQVLQNWVTTTKHELHYPFIFRCTGGSRAWLAPHRETELCYIGFLVYLAADGTAKPGSFEMMYELQQILVPLGGIPHWGKHISGDLYAWSELFPKLSLFKAMMQTLDPMQKWQNKFTREFFQPIATSAADLAQAQTLIACCNRIYPRLGSKL